jgi:CBS domain-containing protein
MSKRARVHVEDLMSTALLSMREGDRVSVALREMTLASVRHLPVVDAKGAIVGLVSSTDLVAAVGRKEDPELREVMTRDVHTVTPDTPAENAVALMLDQKFNAVPVVGKGGEVVGIVTATDFLVVAYQALTGAPIGRDPDER